MAAAAVNDRPERETRGEHRGTAAERDTRDSPNERKKALVSKATHGL